MGYEKGTIQCSITTIVGNAAVSMFQLNVAILTIGVTYKRWEGKYYNIILADQLL